MGRVISYGEKTGYNDGDYLLIDNSEGGTKRIRADRVGIQLDPTLTDPNKAAPANAVKTVKEDLLQLYSTGITVEQGYWAIASGASVDSNVWCKSPSFVPQNVRISSLTNAIVLYLLAICNNSFSNRGTKVYKTSDEANYNYNSCNVVAIDASNNLLKLYRVGANITVTGKKRNGFVWNYASNALVAEW